MYVVRSRIGKSPRHFRRGSMRLPMSQTNPLNASLPCIMRPEGRLEQTICLERIRGVGDARRRLRQARRLFVFGAHPLVPRRSFLCAHAQECEEELRSTLEDWVLLGLKLRHRLPVIGNIDLNKEPV